MNARELDRYDIIVRDGEDIGCIRVDIEPDHLFLDYVALLPEDHNQGLGTELIRRILEDADR